MVTDAITERKKKTEAPKTKSSNLIIGNTLYAEFIQMFKIKKSSEYWTSYPISTSMF
jgi:hypothetical protein